MKRVILCRLGLIATVLATAATAPALAQIGSSSCDGLWHQRNAVYKAAGYCFRTPRGIKAFGNVGCEFGDEADVPLSTREREQIAAIRATERQLGCAP